jgi:sugar lactone lactonase YvrE
LNTEILFVPPTEELRFLPECPRLMRNLGYSDQHLGWVAIQHSVADTTGSFNLLNLRTLQNTNYPVPGRPGFFVETTQPGVILLPLDRRLALLDLVHGKLHDPGWVATHDERCIINDGIPVPDGVIFGTKHLAFQEHIAEIYHFSAATKKITRLVGNQVCSNGKHLYLKDGEVYLADICSASKQVSRYKFDKSTGRMSYHGVIADFTDGDVFPDGMRATPDEQGLVVAFYDPRMQPKGYAKQYGLHTGEWQAEWTFDGAPRVTCPEIAMIDGKVRLIATTATEGMPDEIRKVAPASGAIFMGPTLWSREPLPPPLVAVDTPIPI